MVYDQPSYSTRYLYSKVISLLSSFCLAALLLLMMQNAGAHGGVAMEDDLCVITIAYRSAHFKMYVPRTRRHEEFCEYLPEAAESVFVFEYIDRELAGISFDFRIIRNVTSRRRYTNEEDVANIGDLNDITVFYQSARVEPDVFTAIHHFDKPGAYIGIVTAKPAGSDMIYTTVFPFQVGFAGFGYWPLMLTVIFLYLIFIGYTHGWIPCRRILDSSRFISAFKTLYRGPTKE